MQMVERSTKFHQQAQSASHIECSLVRVCSCQFHLLNSCATGISLLSRQRCGLFLLVNGPRVACHCVLYIKL